MVAGMSHGLLISGWVKSQYETIGPFLEFAGTSRRMLYWLITSANAMVGATPTPATNREVPTLTGWHFFFFDCNHFTHFPIAIDIGFIFWYITIYRQVKESFPDFTIYNFF